MSAAIEFNRMRRALSALAWALLPAVAAAQPTVPFTEDFANDSANWRGATGVNSLAWHATGGPDGGAYASGPFNFVNSNPGDTPGLLRGQQAYGSSGGAFSGNWIDAGVSLFTMQVRHDAPLPLTFFTRFASPLNFPGGVAIAFQPVRPNEWTPISIPINPGNPQFVTFEGSDFQTVFSNIGNIQVAVEVPAELAGRNQAFNFDIDKVSIVPEPATLTLLAPGLLWLRRRRDQSRDRKGATRLIGQSRNRPHSRVENTAEGGRATLSRRAVRVVMYGFALALAAPAVAETYRFQIPSDDRWHYPFNFTPGSRPVASCFGAPGAGNNFFNDRDGQLLIAWNSAAQIAPGQGSGAYIIRSVRVVLSNIPGAQWQVDLTPDEWFTFDVDGDGTINADGIPRGQPGDRDGESDDADPGRPVELFGVGFGPNTSYETWNEFTFYEGSNSLENLPRDPFPFMFQPFTAEKLHVEDNVKGLHNGGLFLPVLEFTPRPWAVGRPANYTPGAQPAPFDVVFEVDLSQSHGALRNYFGQQLNGGRVVLYVNSLADAVQMGNPAELPAFVTKEGVAIYPGAHAPILEIDVEINHGPRPKLSASRP